MRCVRSDEDKVYLRHALLQICGFYLHYEGTEVIRNLSKNRVADFFHETSIKTSAKSHKRMLGCHSICRQSRSLRVWWWKKSVCVLHRNTPIYEHLSCLYFQMMLSITRGTVIVGGYEGCQCTFWRKGINHK
jgi:hypothetical protein